MRWALLWGLLIGLVLAPFVLFEAPFNGVAAQIAQGGMSATVAASGILALLMFDVFLPVPSSIISTAAGVLLGFWWGAAIVWTGMMAGCLLGYAVGARGSAAARRLVGPDGLARAAALARRHGGFAIVLCRPVPVLAEATVVFAGIVRAPLRRFLLWTALSNLGIALGYSAFGTWSMRLDSFLVAFTGALVIPGMVLLLFRLFSGRDPRPFRQAAE